MFLSKKKKKEWEQEQVELKKQLILTDDFSWTTQPNQPNTLKYIGGVDISFVKGNEVDACASLVVLRYPDLEVIYEKCEMVKLTLPYISTFLAFREVAFLVKLIEELKSTKPEILPQVIMVDGNGYLHPRGFGVGCHLGVLTGIPTIGIGKTLLFVDGLGIKQVKKMFREQCKNAGDFCPLIGQSGICWGAAFKSTVDSTNPIFVSVGHKISLETAMTLSKITCNFRVPEPVRQADLRSRKYLRKHGYS